MKIVFTLSLLLLIKTTLTCSTGQYLDQSGTCQNCHYRCTTCSSYSNCQLCKSDYYIDGSTGQCFTCGEGCSCDGVTQDCDTSSLGYIILGAILGPFGALLIIMLCCFYCKQQEEEEQGEQYQDSSQNYITEINLNPNKNVPLVGGLLSLHRRQWTTSHQTYTIDKTSACSICLQQGVDFRTNCNHLFHVRCFAHWMRRSIHCPLCKGKVMRDLRKYCQKCGRNYVSLNVRNINKYLTEFYQICIFCRDEIRMLQTLSQGEMSHQMG